MDGTLFIVATPIGNLEDITLRALKVLNEVDLIAAEDTRTTRKLLAHYNIHTPLCSYFEANERVKTKNLIEELKKGKDIALVSKAGTPGISDPGYRVIHEAVERDIKVVPIPGVTAAVAALSVSGLPLDRFIFEGFLPFRRGRRKNYLKRLCEEERTLIFYESPRRIISTLEDIKEIFGLRKVSLARELTKAFEEIIYGSIEEVIETLKGRTIKGEITLVIEGKRKK